MPSARGALVFGAGLLLWLGARVTGSTTLHMVAVGVVALPFVAALFARWSRQRLSVHRRLSDNRVRPGQWVTVELEVENQGPSATSFLLLEDRVPASLGRPARMVITGLRGHRSQRVTYTLAPQGRGRYSLGPLSADVTDPFALTKVRLEFDEHDELLVTPQIEQLSGGDTSPFGPSFGLSLARHLLRTGDEFYTMRAYQEGDDLRRIHWPSVARKGELMIRQDESSRRASALVFFDNRISALGETHSPAFEKGVSVAASIAVLLGGTGFSLHFATAQHPPRLVTEDTLLDAMAGLSHDPSRSLSSGLTRLRSGSTSDEVLVVVTAPPVPNELASLIRTGAGFGPKIAVLVYPIDPDALPPDRQAHLEGRASVARLSMTRAGWDVLVLPPTGSLREAWHANRTTVPVATGSSR